MKISVLAKKIERIADQRGVDVVHLRRNPDHLKGTPFDVEDITKELINEAEAHRRMEMNNILRRVYNINQRQEQFEQDEPPPPKIKKKVKS